MHRFLLSAAAIFGLNAAVTLGGFQKQHWAYGQENAMRAASPLVGPFYAGTVKALGQVPEAALGLWFRKSETRR